MAKVAGSGGSVSSAGKKPKKSPPKTPRVPKKPPAKKPPKKPSGGLKGDIKNAIDIPKNVKKKKDAVAKLNKEM